MDNSREPMRPKEWLDRNPDRLREMPAEVLERHKAAGPDAFQLEIVAAPRGDKATVFRAPDGTPIQPGKTLREYQEQFGGNEGEIEHPFTGEMVAVSLKRWAASDPDNTIILISFSNRRSAQS